MAVRKSINISGSGASFEAAVHEAMDRASATLEGITRFEEEDGKIARIRSYCFSPELAAEIAEALGLKVGWIPYRFPTPAP